MSMTETVVSIFQQLSPKKQEIALYVMELLLLKEESEAKQRDAELNLEADAFMDILNRAFGVEKTPDNQKKARTFVELLLEDSDEATPAAID